jgi:Holliday junction DNA helicase RuvB
MIITEEVDKKIDKVLRPKTLSDFIGQNDLKEKLRVAIDACCKRNDCLDSILIGGPSGLGKTTISQIIALECNSECKTYTAASIQRIPDLIEILVKLKNKDFLFIDEVHGLKPCIEEILYSAVDEYKIEMRVGGSRKEIVTIKTNPFTLIAATTKPGCLSTPMRNRFGIYHLMQYYSPEQIALIIEANAHKLGLKIDHNAVMEIAIRSRGVPRLCNRLLRRVRDFADAYNSSIDQELVIKAMQLEKIDSLGLSALDRRYMKTMVSEFGGGPCGINAISSCLNEDKNTIVEDVEPFLLRSGLIYLTQRGRQLSSKGWNMVL